LKPLPSSSDPVRPEGPAHETRVLWVVGLGAFLSAVSTSVVGVILPRIGASYELGVVEVQWTMLVPLIVISVGLLPVGRAGDLVGHRRVYLAGLLLVGAAGFACALAPSFGLFLAARGVQGVGAAALMATSPALVSMLARPGRRGRALGIVSTATYLGLTAGPPLGGFLEHLGGWRLVFWVQVPLSFVLLAISLPWLPGVGGRKSGRQVDWPGVALLGLGLTSVLLAFGRIDALGSGARWALGLVGVVGLGAFFAWQWRARSPLLDLRLFADRTFASASLGALLNYLAVFHATFLMPFYLEDLLDMSPGRAGLFLTAMPADGADGDAQRAPVRSVGQPLAVGGRDRGVRPGAGRPGHAVRDVAAAGPGGPALPAGRGGGRVRVPQHERADVVGAAATTGHRRRRDGPGPEPGHAGRDVDVRGVVRDGP
jgi:MFS family permease